MHITTQLSITSAVAGGLVAAAIGFAAPNVAAPNGPSDVQQTIAQLQAQGYHVVVNRLGSSPLDQATVVSVRHGQTFSRTDITPATKQTVYVDVI